MSIDPGFVASSIVLDPLRAIPTPSRAVRSTAVRSKAVRSTAMRLNPLSDGITTHRATPDDAAALAAVHSASATAAYRHIFPPDSPAPSPAELTPGWTALLESPQVQAFVACAGRTVGSEPDRDRSPIVGGVAVGPEPQVPSGWLLTRLYVHPEHWAGGAGSALHDRAVEAVAPMADSLNLWVLEENERGRRFYEQRGWRLVPGRYLLNDPPEVRDVLYQRDPPRGQ